MTIEVLIIPKITRLENVGLNVNEIVECVNGLVANTIEDNESESEWLTLDIIFIYNKSEESSKLKWCDSVQLMLAANRKS